MIKYVPIAIVGLICLSFGIGGCFQADSAATWVPQPYVSRLPLEAQVIYIKHKEESDAKPKAWLEMPSIYVSLIFTGLGFIILSSVIYEQTKKTN